MFAKPLMSWFHSYLSKRKQLLKINDFCTSPVNVTSSVRQGWHLSSVLFALFVNSIKYVIKHSELLIFTDDIKLFFRIFTTEDYKRLKFDRNDVYRWAQGLDLELSIPK